MRFLLVVEVSHRQSEINGRVISLPGFQGEIPHLFAFTKILSFGILLLLNPYSHSIVFFFFVIFYPYVLLYLNRYNTSLSADEIALFFGTWQVHFAKVNGDLLAYVNSNSVLEPKDEVASRNKAKNVSDYQTLLECIFIIFSFDNTLTDRGCCL